MNEYDFSWPTAALLVVVGLGIFAMFLQVLEQLAKQGRL
jgi:uncharacterized membrane protein YhhN